MFKLFIAVVIAFLLDNPEWVGHWEAQRDIAYDSIMSEYYLDVEDNSPAEIDPTGEVY